MNCQACKYYNGTYQTNFSEYINCVKPNYKGIEAWKWVSSKLKECKDFEPKESLTCGDCVYFTTKHPELTEYCKCEKQTTDEYQAYVVADKKVCKDFEESWESESE